MIAYWQRCHLLAIFKIGLMSNHLTLRFLNEVAELERFCSNHDFVLSLRRKMKLCHSVNRIIEMLVKSMTLYSFIFSNLSVDIYWFMLFNRCAEEHWILGTNLNQIYFFKLVHGSLRTSHANRPTSDKLQQMYFWYNSFKAKRICTSFSPS